MIAAIPTVYRGVQFRSRLEAKWACFFDLCGWPWRYEPIDLPGWTPDFVLGWNHTLVEVKPYFCEDDFGPAIEKIDTAGCQASVVLLGAAPREATGVHGPRLGWISEVWKNRDGTCVRTSWDLDFGYTEGNGRLGLCPIDGVWVNTIWEAPKGDPYANKWARVCRTNIDPHSPDAAELLQDFWSHASNVTQWRGQQCR